MRVNATWRSSNGVKSIPSVVYWEPAGYRPLVLDLYLPLNSVERPSTGFPLVMYIHGGGWIGGDRHRSGPFVDFPGVLASLAAKGYVVTSIEYRLSSEAKFPAPAQDVKAALRWLRLNASKYNIDPGHGELVCSSQSSSCKALSSIELHIAQQSDSLGVTKGHGNERISSDSSLVFFAMQLTIHFSKCR